MPHIHDLIDFAVLVYIVYQNKVLLVDHKQLKTWLPVGGHIELHEDPEEALLREVQEECGLQIKLLEKSPKFRLKDVKSLPSPSYLNIHQISSTHKHIGLIYFAKAKSNKVKLAEKEHNGIRWFSEKELEDPHFSIREDIKFYAKKALK